MNGFQAPLNYVLAFKTFWVKSTEFQTKDFFFPKSHKLTKINHLY